MEKSGRLCFYNLAIIKSRRFMYLTYTLKIFIKNILRYGRLYIYDEKLKNNGRIPMNSKTNPRLNSMTDILNFYQKERKNIITR